MKKLILTLFVASTFAITNSLNAQYSIVAGLNLANVSGSDADDLGTETRPGIRIGAAASTDLTDQITLTSGVLYSVKGFAFELDGFDNAGNSTSIKGDQSLNYLEIPVDISYNITDQFAITTGLYTGFFLGQTYTLDGEDFSDQIDEDEISKIDTGLGFGARLNFSESVALNAGYQLGMTFLDADQDLDIKTSNIVIGMSYSF